MGRSSVASINIGIDEVGRGAWAGPLVIAAYFLVPGRKLSEKGIIVRDSKQMTRLQREKTSKILQLLGIYDIEVISVEDIDSGGLQEAYKQGLLALSDRIAMRASIYGDYKLWIDGRRVVDLHCNHEYIIKGDNIMKVISAASIIAKVFRDNYMIQLAKRYQGYGFEKSVGYGTRVHQKAITLHGICDEHRKSFAPIRNIWKH